MHVKIIFSIALLFFSLILHAQNWDLSKDKNGIRVYTATDDQSKYKMIKVEATFFGTIDKLVSIIKNVSNNKTWVYNTRQAHLITTISENEFLYYAETSLPWPLSNRDMAINMNLSADPANNNLQIVATGKPDAIPRKDGLVRIPLFNGVWNVKQVDNDKISIVYILKMNPGGNISAGVSNMFVSKGPFETFNNLSKQLKQ